MSITSQQNLSSTSPQSDNSVPHEPHSFYDPMAEDRLKHRFAEIRNLNDNWDEQGAMAPEHNIVESAIIFCSRLVTCPSPSVSPTLEGGIQLEWTCRNRSLEIEFEAPDRVSYIAWESGKGSAQEGEFSWPAMSTAVSPDLDAKFHSLINWLRGE